MSGDAHRSSAEPRQTPAADVTFSSTTAGRRQQGESSSLAGSRGSGERWSEKGERLKEKFLTPDHGSENGSVGDGASERKRRSGLRLSGHGGFLRDGIFGNGTLKSTENTNANGRKEGKRKVEKEEVQVDNKRLAGHRISGESSVRSSPLSREVSISQSTQDGEQDHNANTRPTTMDPAQLVQMALSLNESRKRHASGSLPIPTSIPRSRNVSAAGDKYGTVRTRASDRPRLDSQFNTPSPGSSNRSRDRQPPISANAVEDNVLYTFSPATLARAERTRKYFELASEHRRLLEHLPPLKPDASAQGNYTFESRSSPGFAQPDIRRVRSNTTSRHELGRQYNPLQILRNRRLRNRERTPFNIQPEQFSDSQRVGAWMDEVEEAASNPQYRAAGDVVNLPHFPMQPGAVDGEGGASKGHKRTGTAGSVITRPENDWSIDPTERLADTYWVEQGDNKTLVENRRRQAIFPARAKPSTDIPRQSMESSHKEFSEPAASIPEEETQQQEAPRKHRHMLSLHKADRIRHDRLSRLARSASGSSGSSDEGRIPRSTTRDSGTPDSLVPLNKHMDALIARDQRGDLSSPDNNSPDHWDSKNTPFPTRGDKRISVHRANGSLSVASNDPSQRSKSADGRLAQLAESDRARFSFDSSPPSSPIVTDFVPSLAMDLSPPPKRPSHSTSKSKHRMLPIFRSKSKDRSTTEGRDFALASESDRSREPSGNAVDPSRLSVEYARPTPLHRHKTSESVDSSIHRRGTSRTQNTTDGSVKDQGKTVGRFFKGGRLAELVRNDRKGRKDKDGSGSTDVSALTTDISDAEDSVGELANASNSLDDELSPRTSVDNLRNKQRLHIPNLPTFRSAAGREKSSSSRLTPVISAEDGDQDHISRQAAARRETSRSPRIDRLLPPRINLPDDDTASANDLPSQMSEALLDEHKRKSYGFLAPRGSNGSAVSSNVSFDTTSNRGRRNAQYPITGLAHLSAETGRRHWSISDRGMREQARNALLKNQRVSPRDLARARALLLASGIKAHSLATRANSPKNPPPSFLATAAQTANTRQVYQANTSHRLHLRLADLKSLVADKLTQIVHNSSDEADAFGVRLTTEQTLRIKQVDDAVDDILRLRRRQFRLLKRAGFKFLEWLVLGIMWWVWFVVVCWNSVKKVFVGIWKALRWLLSF
ncbi:hypothetical protein Q7P37_006949 [Cladosporium fusiforme]